MVKKFSEELKEQRIKIEMSLQQLHAKTRIDIKFLEAIENGNFEILPEVYLRAFIKDYAKTVGLDQEVTLKKYDAAKSGKLLDEEISSEQIEHEKGKVSDARKYTAEEILPPEPYESHSSRRSKNNIYLGVGAVIFLLLIVIGYLYLFKNPSDIITERPYEEIVAENKAAESETPVKVDSDQSVTNDTLKSTAINDTLNLVIKSRSTSWLLVKTDDSSSIFDFILRPNTEKQLLAAKRFNITVGNSAGVEFILNGNHLNFSGGPKEVKRIEINKAGLKYIK